MFILFFIITLSVIGEVFPYFFHKITKLPVKLLKLHQLQVMRGTQLATQIEAGDVDCIRWSAREYAAFCARLSSMIPPEVIVERWVAQAPSHLLLFPKWGLKPQQFQTILQNEIDILQQYDKSQ